MKLRLHTLLLTAALALPAMAQQPPQDQRPAPPHQQGMPGPMGKWWTIPEVQQKLNLSPDQQKKMDDVFQQNRLKLIDLRANLQRAEAMLEPLIAADPVDENQVLAQIDVVAQARAQLEKQTARMLLEFRRNLSADQWRTLQGMYEAHKMMRQGHPGPGGPGGPQ